ncbi:MAG: hypothetical protein JNK82_38045 [Myxococcaceae bacterium]|nr:hypothetical protein [Myxococcaceae bacterium]
MAPLQRPMKTFWWLPLMAACAASQPAVRPETDDEPYFCKYNKSGTELPHGTFSLTRDGAPVMTFEPNKARPTGVDIKLPWGPGDQPIKGAFTTGWVTYRMYLKPSRPIAIYTASQPQLGVLELGPWAKLEHLGTEGDAMRAGVKLDREFRSMRPPEVSLKCTDTAIVSQGWGFSDEEADAGTRPTVELVVNQDVAVSMTPRGTTDGVLHFEGDEERVVSAQVLEELPDAVRVRVHAGPGRVTGWVARRFTKPARPLSNVFGVGGLGLRGGEGKGKPSWARCKQGVPLFVVHDGALRAAGELDKNAAYEVVAEREGFTEVRLPENAWLELQPGFAWGFKPGDLEVCRARRP